MGGKKGAAGAPKGNDYWKLRKKHVPRIPKAYADPAKLWNDACDYFDHCDANPWKKTDWVGKDAIEIERESQTPYTISGLCAHLGLSRQWWYDAQKEERYAEFKPVFEQIDLIIETQQFEGAAVGAFNPSLIMRNLKLVDKQEHDHTTQGEKIKQVFQIGGQTIEFE